MNEANPTLTAADKEAIAEFCQYELVTLTQFDAYRVKATFPDSVGNVESVIRSSVVSVLLEVARRQKVSAYLRGTRAMEQQLMEALHKLPGALTITKGEQGYTWQVLAQNGTAYTLPEAVSRSLEAMIEQLSTKHP